MTTTDDMTRLKISGPDGLLAVVPAMLGFHPADSLVLLCLNGRRRRVGPVIRVDLPPGRDRALTEQLTAHALNHAEEVVVVTYQESRRRPPLLSDVLAEFERAGVEVMAVFSVRDGLARPARTRSEERSHPGFPLPGDDDPQVTGLAAARVLAGRGILANREQLRRSIAAPVGDRLQEVERHIEEAAAGRLSPVPRGQNRSTTQTRHRHLRSIDGPAMLTEFALTQVATTGDISAETAAALAVGMTDIAVRDDILNQAVVDIDRPWLPMLVACARWTPQALAADVCAVLATVAYRHGDGALAQVAVDRSLESEPEHRLAHLMVGMMCAGIRPEELHYLAGGEESLIGADADRW